MAQFVEQVEGKDRISELTLKDIGNNVKVAVGNISDKSLGELFHDASGKLHDFASGIAAHLKEAVGRSAMGVLTSGLGTIVAAVGDTYIDGYQDVQQESQLEQEERGSSQPADDFECDY